MDALQDQLARARATGGVFARSVVDPPWGLLIPGSVELTLHTVVQGHAWVWVGGDKEAIELAPGDLALVRGGPDHRIAHRKGAHCQTPEQFRQHHKDDDQAEQPGGTVFLCGAYRFPSDVGQGLIKALPPVLVLRPAAHDPLHSVIALLSRELATAAPGRQTVLDRLLDILLVMSMRSSFEDSPTAPRWYQAASDPRLSAALHAIHSEPDQAWSVQALADLAKVSRPTFARTFEKSLGQSPMAYLTDWRMTLARDYLRGDELSVNQIATRTGYSSPNAFATAFRRHHGASPAQWRREADGDVLVGAGH